MTPVYLESAHWIEHDSNQENPLFLQAEAKAASIKPFSSFSKRPKRLATKPSKRA